MYIRQIRLKNFGPIGDLLIESRLLDNGSPVPIVLVGQNGAGKSLTLAVVLDAVTEARKVSFTKLQEVGGTDYLRISSKSYVRLSRGYSHSRVIISDGVFELNFDEVVSLMPYDVFEKEVNQLMSLPNIKNGEFERSGFYKHITFSDERKEQERQKEQVRRLTFLYFPYFRYEPAYWMSGAVNIVFVKTANFYGQSKLNPIRVNIIEETNRWILNVLLDREIYEKVILPCQAQDGSSINAFFGYNGPNARMFQMVNQVLFSMLQAKDPDITSARLGISPKGKRGISVYVRREDEAEEEVVAPDISQLSSGELMTLGLTTEIIRAYEINAGKAPNALNEITGIVLIDEIDLHLHVSFQKNVLPVVIRSFPNVQFIMTTHSPFFLMGMAETGEVDIYNLPIGNKISTEEFSEFQAGYDIFIQKNEQFRSRYLAINEMMQKEGRALVITEGKTDWKHIKHALTYFSSKNEYQDLGIDFFEFESDIKMGDSKLSQMCEYMATIPQRRKIIFVFDRDNPSITERMSGEPGEFKDWGNQVFSVCLPIPPHRKNYKNLSIELYYTDNDLRTVDPASGKRLWFTNEIEIITRPARGEKIYRSLNDPFEQDELEKKVFDQPAEHIVNDKGEAVGLSKSAFVEVIIGNPDISKGFSRDAFKPLFDVIRIICGPN